MDPGTPAIDPESDQSLLPRCRAGNQQAWSELVRRYERLVYSVPRSHGLDAEDSADVTQATFAALLTGLASLADDDALVPWLGTVARRQTWRVIDARRRARDLSAKVEHHTVAEPGADPYDDWLSRAWLTQGLATLDPGCRDLLTALYLEGGGTSYKLAAARLGLAVGTIGPARARCLHRLRELMEQDRS